jgi:hypothetical protein
MTRDSEGFIWDEAVSDDAAHQIDDAIGIRALAHSVQLTDRTELRGALLQFMSKLP